MNIYLIILIVVLVAFVLVALSRMLARRDLPHPHWSDGDAGQDAGDQRNAARGDGGDVNDR